MLHPVAFSDFECQIKDYHSFTWNSNSLRRRFVSIWILKPHQTHMQTHPCAALVVMLALGIAAWAPKASSPTELA